jgi:hypothetical protein
MKTENLEKLNLLFIRFKTSNFYKNRTNQLGFCSIAEDVIRETINLDSITNHHLTGFIQMFKINSSISTFSNYLKNLVSSDKYKEILDDFTSSEIRGYTAAGRFTIKNLDKNQLEEVKSFLLSAFEVKSVDDAVSLVKEFESLNIPEVKRGIYSPWLYYINPKLFPIVNSSSKNLIKWMKMSSSYSDLIYEFHEIKKHLNVNDFGIIDSFIYDTDKYLKVKDNILVRLFSMSLSDEKLKQVFEVIKDKESEYSNVIKNEYYFRNNIIDETQRYWVVGSFTSLEDIGLIGVKDRTEYFVDNGVWINGYRKKYNDIVNSIKIGDKISIKAVFSKDTKSFMRIKAIGSVIENIKDGRTLKVNWVKDFNEYDVEFTGGYWSTISEVKLKEHIDIIWNI